MNVYPDDTLCEKRDFSKRVVLFPFQRVRIRFLTVGESRTVQDHRDSADINQIIARFSRTGVAPVGRGPGQHLDVSGVQTSDTASAIVKSREVLSQASEKLRVSRSEKAKAAQAKAAADAKELEDLRAAKAAAEAAVKPS